jgi:hypothetical protein
MDRTIPEWGMRRGGFTVRDLVQTIIETEEMGKLFMIIDYQLKA